MLVRAAQSGQMLSMGFIQNAKISVLMEGFFWGKQAGNRAKQVRRGDA